MKFSITNLSIAATLLLAATTKPISAAKTMKCDTSYGVIANRGSGDLTVIAQDGSAVFNFPLPAPDATSTERSSNAAILKNPEPMYVSYTRDHIFVGDRANNAMVVINPMALEEKPKIINSISDGIFHQWSNDDTLVVSCDIANHVTIISLDTMMVEATIDLMDQGDDYSIVDGQKPHDIVITPSGDAIFVSIVGSTSGDGFKDAILKIDTSTKRVVKKLDLPGNADPHLGLSSANPDLIYSPQQNLGIVAVYKQSDLTEVQNALEIPNAHGIGSTADGYFLYVTNIANGGVGALNTILTKTGDESIASIKGGAIDTPNAVPHNIAVTKDGYVFVTHSGADAMSISVFSTNDDDGIPTFEATYTAGTNPFGLAIARYACAAKPESFNFEVIGSPKVSSTPKRQSAGYTITFSNYWTAQRHPYKYPENAHWSDFVYASHNTYYQMWCNDCYASRGVEMISEEGKTTKLRRQIESVQKKGDVLDQVLGYYIKKATQGATSSPKNDLCVDYDHPYVSAISMIAPSPDWFSGLYNLPLYDDHSEYWYEKIELYVYAWDAGTEDGDDYSLDNKATKPREGISAFMAGDTMNEVFVSKNEKNGKFQVLPVGMLTFELQGPSKKCASVQPLDTTERFYVMAGPHNKLRRRRCHWASMSPLSRCDIMVRTMDGAKTGDRVRNLCPVTCKD